MTIAMKSRARGLVAVPADTGSAAAILNELRQTFETFKAERESRPSRARGSKPYADKGRDPATGSRPSRARGSKRGAVDR